MDQSYRVHVDESPGKHAGQSSGQKSRKITDLELLRSWVTKMKEDKDRAKEDKDRAKEDKDRAKEGKDKAKEGKDKAKEDKDKAEEIRLK
ncbi:hypothetical protein UCDDS831_g08660 [Diplodia seriata]|uniref:Uncharacterized protein n=1 Tax=Diplodia seriata TaxID=420778 RepID=A0A0G2G9M9_9PEZI|nr:hypothetical protein UCDDS831_g08660 [Diplodia seriata]